MKTRFFALALSLLMLTACSLFPVQGTSYRWEMYDLNFVYPEELTIHEDKQILFNGYLFDVLIITEGDLANNTMAGLEIEIMARMNSSVDAMLSSFGETMEYEDKGTVRAAGDKFRKICYDLFSVNRCSYLIEKNGNYYQFNLQDEYRDDFLRSLEFIE
jgi:hypothetical protein